MEIPYQNTKYEHRHRQQEGDHEPPIFPGGAASEPMKLDGKGRPVWLHDTRRPRKNHRWSRNAYEDRGSLRSPVRLDRLLGFIGAPALMKLVRIMRTGGT